MAPRLPVRVPCAAAARAFTTTAAHADATLLSSAELSEVTVTSGAVAGVVLTGGREVLAGAVLAACDPWRAAGLAGDAVPHALTDRLAGLRRPAPP